MWKKNKVDLMCTLLEYVLYTKGPAVQWLHLSEGILYKILKNV